MKQLILVMILLPTLCFSQSDTIKLKKLKEQILTLSDKVEKIDKNQINYTIEKDLLKETYNVNFERINLFVTAILGLFAVLSFLGLRDVNSIKKEYSEELNKFRELQTDIELKSREFDISKQKYDEEIKGILKQSEDQSKKIKVLEIKDRMNNLFKEKAFAAALQNCNVALEILPDDQDLQLDKGRILSKLYKISEAIKVYEDILSNDSSNSIAIINITELYLFNKQIGEAEGLMKNYPDAYKKQRAVDLVAFFDLLKKYHANDIEGMKNYAKLIIDVHNPDIHKKINGWDFTDAIVFAYNEEQGERRKVLSTILFFLDGKYTSTDFNNLLNLNSLPI